MSDNLVKVYNRNKYEYSEMFNGKEILIPAGKHVMMDYEEANRFLGKLGKFTRTKDGQQDPRSFKWLEIDKEDRRRVELLLRAEADEKATKIFVCHMCGKEFSSKKLLMGHIKSEHADDIIDDDGVAQLAAVPDGKVKG